MPYPSLVKYSKVEEYKSHFERIYCSGTITTFDGIHIRFRKQNFEHCFYESIKVKDDTFSQKRAERIDWIKAALKDPKSEMYQGWNKRKNKYDKSRRVVIVMGNYIVVIVMIGKNKADFITAYVADTAGYKNRPSTLDKIRMGPKWK